MRAPLLICCRTITLVSLTGAVMALAQTPEATPTYRVGLKSVAIPPPSSDLPETGSDYRVLLELMAPNQNRLIAAFLIPDELKALTTSKTSTSFTRYALAETSRRGEFATMTPELFKQVTDSMGQQFGATMNSTLKDQEDEANRKLKVYNDSAPKVTLDQPYMLGTLFSKPNASGFGMIMQGTVNGNSKRMAVGVSIVRVQERVLYLYLFNSSDDEESIRWIRAATENWVNAVLKANQ